MSGDTPNDTAQPSTLPLEVGGHLFTLHVYADPSGLRGQVFDGEEKLAGVQVFHTTDVERLIALARRDRAVLRAVQRRTPHRSGTC
jgi:hypothetical protein